ncbi:MAG: hypothetical protein AAFV95_25815 [Bacteroidota bacterium]
MNIDQYIASGKLEAYLLGGLSPPEIREVEQFASTYPIIREELQKMEVVIEVHARLGAIRIPQRVEQKILQKISHLSRQAALQKTKQKRRLSLLLLLILMALLWLTHF